MYYVRSDGSSKCGVNTPLLIEFDPLDDILDGRYIYVVGNEHEIVQLRFYYGM